MALQNKTLAKANECRNLAFKLRPNKMGDKLVTQLEALDVKLQELAGEIQERVNQKKEKESDYADLKKRATRHKRCRCNSFHLRCSFL